MSSKPTIIITNFATVVATVASLLIASSTTMAHANKPAKRLKLAQLRPEIPNGDYLNRIAKPKYKDESISTMLLNSDAGREMQARYGLMQKRHEMRKNHGLTSYYYQSQDMQENQSLAEDSVGRMVKVEMRNNVRNSIKTAYKRDYLDRRKKKQNPTKKAADVSTNIAATPNDKATLSAVDKKDSVESKSENETSDAADVGQAVVDVADFIYRAQMGTEIDLADTTRAHVRTDILKGKYSLGLDNEILNSSIDYRANSLDPINKQRISSTDERANVSVSRPIKPLRASTGARYGLLQKTLSYGVDKQIVGNLSANVSRNTYLRERSRDEMIYGVSYSLSF